MLWRYFLMAVTSLSCPKFVTLSYTTSTSFQVSIAFQVKNTNLLGVEFIVAFYKWTIFIVLSDSPTVQTHASFFYYRRFILLKSFDPTWTLMCIAISIISSMNSDMMCTVYPVSVLVFTRKHGSSWLKNNSNSGYKYNSNMLGKLLHFPLS